MIDEKKLIEELRKYANELITIRGEIELGNGVLKAISIVKKQQKVGEWIPCSERLPEEHTNYKGIKRSYYHLVTVKAYGKPKISIDYTVNGHWHLEEGNTVLKVTRWQPLPEPWKGETE